MYNENITLFAETTFRNRNQKFGIKVDDRRRHMYLIGKTGMGKSTVMENMIVHDIRAGRGVAVVDPHGDLAEKIMDYIPTDRIKDIVYFNPADMEFPIAFNIVEQVDISVRHLVASGLVGVFKKLWADSWGPRLEYILRNAILAILDYPHSSLLGVVRMLSDKVYRKKVVASISDPVVKAFWEKEFASYADKFASEAVSPIQNKVGQFLSSALVRNIVGQEKSAINMREVMDSSKILILNLSKGHIGEDSSALLGAMMITKIQLAAMSRVDTTEANRRDFYLYIDEFQNFNTESFATILSEARKYRLNLIMAHQYIEQLDEKVCAAVFGNVGTLICFRVGAIDAEELVKEFTPTFLEEDILNLPKYEFYLKLMIDGIASDPFSARGLKPLSEEEKTGNLEKCIEYTRKHYSKKRVDTEAEIMATHFAEPAKPIPSVVNKPKPSAGSYVNKKSETPKNDISQVVNKIKSTEVASGSVVEKHVHSPKSDEEAVCSSCGKTTYVSFKPDGIRPIYCRDCRSKIRTHKRTEAETKNSNQKNDYKFLNNIAPSDLQKKQEPIKEIAQEKSVEKEEEISLSQLLSPSNILTNGKSQEVTKEKSPQEKEALKEREDIIFE